MMKKLKPRAGMTGIPSAKISEKTRILTFNRQCDALVKSAMTSDRCDVYYDDEELIVNVSFTDTGAFKLGQKNRITMRSLFNVTDKFDFEAHPVRVNGGMLEIDFKQKA